MKCYRCSYCCYYLNTVISLKYSHLKEIDFNVDLPKDFFTHITDPHTDICPHLSWDISIDRAVCNIRNQKWFKDTPCYKYNSIKQEFPKECNIGKYIVEHENLLKKYKDKVIFHDKITL